MIKRIVNNTISMLRGWVFVNTDLVYVEVMLTIECKVLFRRFMLSEKAIIH